MYQNNNYPYSNNQSPYASSSFDKQRQQQDQQIKQNYKQKAEQALDNIIHNLATARLNGNQYHINKADKSVLNRYYNRYWANDFVMISIFILIVSFGASFFTNLASVGILAVLLAYNSYSHSTFLNYFSNDSQITKEDKMVIQDLVFSNQLQSNTVLFLSLAMALISYILSFFTRPIYLDENDPSFVIKLLHNFNINFHNELFAYSVASSILILIFLKIYEKWSN
jgi:hypothetical protein